MTKRHIVQEDDLPLNGSIKKLIISVDSEKTFDKI